MGSWWLLAANMTSNQITPYHCDWFSFARSTIGVVRVVRAAELCSSILEKSLQEKDWWWCGMPVNSASCFCTCVCVCVHAQSYFFVRPYPTVLCVCVRVSRWPTNCEVLWKPILDVRARCAEKKLLETLVMGMMWSLSVNVLVGVGSTQSKQVRVSVTLPLFFFSSFCRQTWVPPPALPLISGIDVDDDQPASSSAAPSMTEEEGKALLWDGMGGVPAGIWYSMSCHADLEKYFLSGGIHQFMA